MGNGMAIQPDHLEREMQHLYDLGVSVTPANLKISNRAPVILPLHRDGSACGVSSVYGDKAVNMALRMGDLLEPAYLSERLNKILGYYHETMVAMDLLSYDELYAYATRYGELLRDFICDTGAYLKEAHDLGMSIIFEAPQGALRDVDFGIYPYTCSSSTVAAYATIGAGVPGLKLDHTIGVLKSFSSMVGDGPFVAELFGEDAAHLLETGNETAEKISHFHRVGAFDAVASRYGVAIQKR